MVRATSKCALCLVLLVWAGVPAAIAGELYLSWSPVEGASGYHVHVGPSSGDYSQITDTGPATDVTLMELADCAPSYFAVTAYNGGGESGYSPELSSWPRPTISSVTSAPLEQGTQRTLAIAGYNLRAGDAVVLSHQGIQVNSAQVSSCGEMTATVTVDASAVLGLSALSIVHPNGVTGFYDTALVVVAPIAPNVLDALPVDGSTEVPVEVQPSVEFSEAVFGTTSSNLRILDEQGVPVAQAPGSPVLSSDGTVATIVPSDPLAGGTTYRIEILGPAGGIVDQDGHPLESGYMQGQGFTTIDDDAPPVASDPAATDIGGTTAVIEWTTDEPASGRVFYRKQGGTLYQAADGADDLLDHAVTLTGLAPETDYEFHVGSTDSSGNTATSSPDSTFSTGFSPHTYIRFESEAGALTPPIDSTLDASGFGGRWIAAAGPGQGTTTSPLGHADYSVHLPHSGEWRLWVRVYAPDEASDSWFESMDGATLEPLATSEYGEWVWIAGRAYTLAAGLHELRLGGHESGARADRILLTDDPEFQPTEAPDVDVTPPAPVSGLEVVFGGGQMQLQWTNPADGDLSRVVLRYRADGQYPMSPVDGLPLVDGPAVPGADGAYTHTGVSLGLTYNYAVFAVDAFDNVSVVTQGSALALAPPPPPADIQVE